MEDPTSGAQLILTPHPVTLEGQRHIAALMQPGEKLGPFLARTVPDWDGDAWEVRINGVLVPHEVLARVRPKTHAVIEVRGIVKKQVLAIVAIAILAYFTMGAGLALYGAAVGVTSAIGMSVLGAVTFAGGSALVTKLLMPKPKAPTPAQSDPVYSIGSARNYPRPYEPIPILFGTVRTTPDVASLPYSWYEGTDQVMGMVLTPGVNVHSVEALYNGDTLLSTYDGVAVYLDGFAGHANQTIPLYSNADTIAGGELNKDQTWVERTTPADTVRVQINLEYLLGDNTSKGKPKNNHETVQVQYRATGSGTWLPMASRNFVNNNYDQKRVTIAADVPAGQYDVRVRRLGNAIEHDHGKATFQWVTMTAVQADTADYAGIPRIGIRITATGQLNGALDEVRCVSKSAECPVWNGTAWEQVIGTGNPGAHVLHYARGIFDENGKIIGGMGLPDDMIDIPALQAFMVHCAVNGYTYNAYIKDARNHTEMLDAIALAGFGQITWAGGKLSVAWAADGQPITSVVNMATIKKASFQVDYTLANAADGIEYSYVDATDWQTKTLRVEAPGITTMQNPARISGEGVTSEAHAAELARFHLAQSLYQYKDINFAQDLEYLSYRRLSVLALQHDLTQWGHGGRLRGASEVGGVVSIALDEPVPAGSTPYVGLRIPGEGAYRVFQVQPFTGETDTLTLVEPWPVDAAFPGDDDDNPAHDTIWIYDFKATPGYRVRVVSIQPESDLKGASIAVVPESPEFWTYVKTGEYTPPANQSLLQTRPIASNLTIAESQVVQGDTVFTELQADFDVDGPMAYATVHVAQQLDGEWGDLVQVTETRTQEARWRIPAAGLYRIVVRPYNADGIVGGVATVDYLTTGADIPPPQFDNFDVVSLPGGVRKYTWGYDIDTLQAPDFAGAEVRYIAGTVPSPTWADMTPVGNADGFHTAGFEAVVPVAGTWTFAARPRNTSGELGPARVITRTLTDNLGEVIDGIEVDLDEVTQAQVDAQEALDQEIADRLAADLDLSNRTDVIAAQVADITSADVWNAATAYPIGDFVQYAGKFYRALTANTNKRPDLNPSDWDLIGNYSSLGQAVAASITIGNQNTSEIAAHADQINAVTASVGSPSSNLVTNPHAEFDTSGWHATGGATVVTFDRNYSSAYTLAPGTFYVRQDSATTGSYRDVRQTNESAIRCAPGERYCVQVLAGAHRCTGRLFVYWYNETTAGLGSSIGNTFSSGPEIVASEALGGVNVSDYKLLTHFITIPANANAFVISLRKHDTLSGVNSFLFFTRIAANKITSAANIVPEWSPNAPGAATATALSSLTATVSSQGDQIGTQATAISGLQASVGGQSASITSLMEVTAGAQQVVLPNPSFELDTGWGSAPTNDTLPTGVTYSGITARSGTRSLRFDANGTVWASSVETTKVRPGEKLNVGVYLRAGTQPNVGAYVEIGVRFYNSAGSSLGDQWFRYTKTAANLPTDYSTLLNGVATAPALASQCRFILRVVSYTSGTFYADDVFIERVDSVAAASVTLATNVNGHISGTRTENDGTTSSFSILATVFRVISTISGMGMEWMDGYLRIWKGSAQLIIGHTFGVSGNMVFWYGPNIGAAACTKANAKIWFDNVGDAYFGGTLSAGVLKNAAQSSQVSTSAAVEIGPFGTNGNSKVVVASLTYSNSGGVATNLGNGSLSATVIVERSYNGGAWTQIGTFNATGNRTVDPFEPGLGYPTTWSLSGSVTVTDTQAGTANFAYRARITAAAGGWPYAIPAPGDSGTQRLSIISTEA